MVGHAEGVAMMHTLSVQEGVVSLDLNDYLPTLGIDLSGWLLTIAHGISADGSVIYGEGWFDGERRWWVATGVPSPGGTATCPADLDANGTTNLDDIQLFVDAFLDNDLLADLTGDGAINLDDIEAFIASFLAGCP